METREVDVIGGYPEHAQICLLEPVSDADYVFGGIAYKPSVFINQIQQQSFVKAFRMISNSAL